MLKTNLNIPSPFEAFQWPQQVQQKFEARNLQLFVKRDDLIHSEISGNKWRKLKMNIEQAKSLGKKGLLTFGGAYSNHLLAVAATCQLMGLESTGLVRGEELNKASNPLLKRCAELGMELIFLSREEYGLKEDWEYLSELKSEFGNRYIVPEGGKNYYGSIGCQEIIKEIKEEFEDFWMAQGTCTTSVGVAFMLKEEQDLHVVPVLKGFDAKEEVRRIVKGQFNDSELADELAGTLIVHDEYHFGGYGKVTDELTSFISATQEDIQLPLDPIYTGKCFYALLDYYTKNENIVDKRIVFLHTGGLYLYA